MLLEEVLRDRDYKLYGLYSDIRNRSRDEFQKQMTSIEGLTDHGEAHHERVEVNLDRLLPTYMKQTMEADAIFVLLCAVQFHDVGLLYHVPEGEPLRIRRKRHPDRSYEYLMDKHDEWNLASAYAIPIADICRRHSGPKRLYAVTKDEYLARNAVIDPIFFGALLRLADELDTSFERVSRTILDMGIVTGDSLKHHLKEKAVLGVKIDPKSWTIKIQAAPDKNETQDVLEEWVKKKIQAELNLMQEALKRGDIYYSDIELDFAGFEPETWQKQVARELGRVFLQKLEVKRPYRFLDYYDLQYRDYFYGRNKDIRKFHGYITSHRITTIFGDSGVGKTSLIKAGCMPRLMREGRVPVYVQCLGEPGELIRAQVLNIVSKLEEIEDSELQELPLRDFFEGLYGMITNNYELYIFLDQFEQFFVQLEEDGRKEFVGELAQCVSDESLNVRFVFSLREEYLPRLGEYDFQVRDFIQNAYLLEALTREEMKDAIVEPAKRFGLEYEAELVTMIIDDVSKGAAFNAPQIQIVCDRLYDASISKGDKLITVALYRELGGAQGILEGFLEQEINKFGPSEREKVKNVLKTLVDPEQTKTALPPETIASYAHSDLSEVKDILQKLEDRSRLVRKIFVDGVTMLELAHEFLVPKIQEWLEEPDRELIRVRRMVENRFKEWEVQQHNVTFLIHKDILGLIPRFRLALGLPSEQEKYVLESCLWNDPANKEKWFWIEELGPDAATAILLKMLHAKSVQVDDSGFKEALETLKRMGVPTTKHLIQALSTSNWRVRQGLISVLIGIGEPCVPLLTGALHSDNRRVRLSVGSALESRGHMP